MHRANIKKNQVVQFSGKIPSKPSKQSLVARGLPVKKKGTANRSGSNAKQNPGFSFYNSSDSDADQVYSMTKKLDKCASLLSNILEEKEPAPKKKANLKSDTHASKRHVKKVVKIVLPTDDQKDVNKGRGHHSDDQQATMITSTPTSNKYRRISTKEDEIKDQLSQITNQKNVLQQQYTNLLRLHQTTPVPTGQTNANMIKNHERHEVFGSKREVASKEHHFQSGLLTTADGEFERNERFSREVRPKTSVSIFKELEDTVSKISDKLSFPAALTPVSSKPSAIRKYGASEDKNTTILKNRNDLYMTERNIPVMHYNHGNITPRGGNRFGDYYDHQDTLSLERGKKRVAWSTELSGTEETTSRTTSSTLASDSNGATNLRSTVNDNNNTYVEGEEVNALDSPSEETDSYESSSEEAVSLNSSQKSFTQKHIDGPKSGETNEESIEVDNAGRNLDTNRWQNDKLIQRMTGTQVDGNVGIHDDENAVHGSELTPNPDDVGTSKTVSKTQNQDKEDNGMQIRKKCNRNDRGKLKHNRSFRNNNSKHAKKLNVDERKEVACKKNSKRVDGKLKGKTVDLQEMSKLQHNQDVTEQSDTKKASDEKDVGIPNYHQSPNTDPSRPLVDITSQLAILKNTAKSKSNVVNGSNGLNTDVKPGYAATQITLLGYLFKELMMVIGDKLSSEEERLFTEIDYIIGLLPFIMNNLNPDLQMEVNLAVQPLRVENSDLRRQLRIANQKIRDFEIHVNELKKDLDKARRTAIGEDELQRLQDQITYDGEQRKLFIEKISDIDKVVDDLKLENKNLLQKLAEKDAEVIRKVQVWQKENSSISSDKILLEQKVESLSLNLQAQEKENKILKLSVCQSEAEIARVKELNRDLRESVAKLLHDVNFKDSRPKTTSRLPNNVGPKTMTNIKTTEMIGQRRHEKGNSKFGTGIKFSTGYEEISNRNLHMANSYACNVNSENIGNDHKVHKSLSSVMKSFVANKNKQAFQDSIKTADQEQTEQKTLSGRLDGRSKNVNVVLSSTLDSASSDSDSAESDHTCSAIASSCVTMDDNYSTLTCDSGEFQNDLANLDADIKKLQKSLKNAKNT